MIWRVDETLRRHHNDKEDQTETVQAMIFGSNLSKGFGVKTALHDFITTAINTQGGGFHCRLGIVIQWP